MCPELGYLFFIDQLLTIFRQPGLDYHPRKSGAAIYDCLRQLMQLLLSLASRFRNP